MRRNAMAAAAAVFVLSAAELTAEAEERPVLPVGGVSRETVMLETGSDISGISLFGGGSSEEEEDDSEPSVRFYGYGGDYAYKDMGQRSHPKERRELYKAILKSCKKIAASERDLLSYETSGEADLNRYREQIIDIPNHISWNELHEVYFMFRNDHPEYYWLPSTCYYAGYSADNIEFLALFLCDEYNEAEERKQADAAIDENVGQCIEYIKAAEPETVYGTAKLAHDYIVGLVEYGYDENGEPLDTVYAHSIAGVFDGDPETDVVCEGYAKAFTLVLNALEIENIYVTGNSYNGIKWGGHAWNMVKLDDGSFYNFDVTWDDAYEPAAYEYFAVGQSFYTDHIPNTPAGVSQYFQYALPEVPKRDYNAPLTDMHRRATRLEENGTYTFEVVFDDYIENSSAMAACYDANGRLLDIKMAEVTADGAVIEGVKVGRDAAYVTLMSWLNDTNVPAVRSIEIGVTQQQNEY